MSLAPGSVDAPRSTRPALTRVSLDLGVDAARLVRHREPPAAAAIPAVRVLT
ncbi:MAG: hypothetical protein LBS49_02200 [Candidatus Accumulibacter sp.]|nr:hypothetical protein [Accumulibacter sp.]